MASEMSNCRQRVRRAVELQVGELVESGGHDWDVYVS